MATARTSASRARSRSETPVLYGKTDGGRIAIVTLNRPEVLNAYDVAMRDALYEALSAVRDDPEVRVMLLRGEGRAFSTGGDLREFGSAPSPYAARAIRWRRDVWGTLLGLTKVSVAVVHGLAVGGGFEMAMLCDQCWASDDARFSLPETGLGMIPGVGGTQTLARGIGVGRAMDLVLSGRAIDAATARRLGLVSVVVPRARLESVALRRARRLARIDPMLVAGLKRAVDAGLNTNLASGLLSERCIAAHVA
jgi:enoyl-CoA hydratase/carnithine racemase